MSFEGPHIGRKQAEADRAAAVAVVDAVDQRRQFLVAAGVGREQVRLMLGDGNEIEQHHADAERFVSRHSFAKAPRGARAKIRLRLRFARRINPHWARGYGVDENLRPFSSNGEPPAGTLGSSVFDAGELTTRVRTKIDNDLAALPEPWDEPRDEEAV